MDTKNDEIDIRNIGIEYLEHCCWLFAERKTHSSPGQKKEILTIHAVAHDAIFIANA